MTLAIKVENLSKAYRLGQLSTGALSQDIERRWALLRGKSDPFLKVGETNVRSEKGTSNIVWSLKDINFEVEKGETIGVIGRNGAGKSTLLKLLSSVTSPTTGKIKLKGRVASLLEVGTGFHPELTGRENIFLNGAILGMKKFEIKQMFDQIVDFSGVERYLDTPVKRYSSGMRVRLGFAVAAHLRSEILIVDEVLAVGDAEFQKKCLGKMSSISSSEGRTILFVSHNMASLKRICNKGILLKDGRVGLIGTIDQAVADYLQGNNKEDYVWTKSSSSRVTDYLELEKMELIDGDNNQITKEVKRDKDLFVRIKVKLKVEEPKITIGIAVFDENEAILFRSMHVDADDKMHEKTSLGMNVLKTRIPTEYLNDGKYRVVFDCSIHKSSWDFNPYDAEAPSVSFKVENPYDFSYFWQNKRAGAIAPLLDWELES